MARPSKKDIKAAIDKLKATDGSNEAPPTGDNSAPSLQAKKSNKNRIRKQGV